MAVSYESEAVPREGHDEGESRRTRPTGVTALGGPQLLSIDELEKETAPDYLVHKLATELRPR